MCNCPSGVRFDDIILSARSLLVEHNRLSYLKRFIFRQLLRRGRLLPPIATWAYWIQKYIFQNLPFFPSNSPFRLLLPLIKLDKNRNFPSFASKSLRKQYPKIIPSNNKSIMRIGYFIGCATDLIYPNIGIALIETLKQNNIEIVMPEQNCCATPIFNSGDFITARELALKNIQSFNDINLDFIITACASGGLAWKREYSELLHIKEANKLKDKVRDISEFLYKEIKLKLGTHPVPIKVTYHDPCHLNRGQGIYEEPRALLKSIKGIEFIEMEDADACCGGGGTFNLTHYELAKKIGMKKINSILKTGAEYVITGCPSCIMQLDDLLKQVNSKVKVIHPIELIYWTYYPDKRF